MKTVRTTIRLLREFTISEPEVGVSELARRLHLDKATVHRMLTSLAAERIVEQDPVSRRYRLGLAVLDLAAARMQSFHFLSAAVGEIQLMRDRIGESIGMHVLDGHEMICLEFAESAQPVRVGFWIGERSPVHLTATGLAALSVLEPAQWKPIVARSIAAYPARPDTSAARMRALLAQAAKAGYAIANETYERGVRAIAIPVGDAGGMAVCTLCVAVPAQRRTEADLKGWVPSLIETGERIERTMIGGHGASIIQRLGLASIRRKG